MKIKYTEYLNPQKVLFYLTLFLGVWLILILTAPVLIASEIRLLQVLGTTVYFLTDPVCHQLPERSLFLGSVPFPVCARCLFIYSGGFIVLLFGQFQNEPKFWSKYLYFGLILIAGSELFSEKILSFHPVLELRIISGFLVGIVIFRLALESLFLTGDKFSNG